jgi:endonuclease YncB( thermonuclease family)
MFPRLALFVTALLLSSSPLLSAEKPMAAGEHVVIQGQSLRLHGVDVPSADEICTTSDGRQWPCGRHVRDELARAVTLDEVICQPAERETAVCRISGIDLGALLVKEGLAKAAGDYQALEDRARAAKIGIWE